MTAAISGVAVSAALFLAVSRASPAVAAAGANAPLPPVLVVANGFSGTVEYTAQRVRPSAAPPVSGVLTVSQGRWSIEETGAGFALRGSAGGTQIRVGSQDFSVDDIYNADALANAWAVAFGQLASGGWSALDARSRTWGQGGGIRAYVDEAGARLLGVSDPEPQVQLSFVFGDWEDVNGVAVPHRILRLRAGAASAEYAATSYRVTRVETAAPIPGAAAAGAFEQSSVAVRPMATASGAPGSSVIARMLTVFALLFAALLIVAWLRRDALLGAACKRLAADPRAFRDVGVSAFVSPEGVLLLNGHAYRVGAQFYGRLALVQLSPLFVRVTAKDVGGAVVLPRRFGPARFAVSRGFSLVEIMVAMTIFALAVVAGVYPALLAISEANAFAAKRAAATRLAVNALTDEEVACAYGPGISAGTKTTTADGFDVTVSVTPANLAGSHNIMVVVTADSAELARVATVVGPPVPAPQPQQGRP